MLQENFLSLCHHQMNVVWVIYYLLRVDEIRHTSLWLLTIPVVSLCSHRSKYWTGICCSITRSKVSCVVSVNHYIGDSYLLAGERNTQTTTRHLAFGRFVVSFDPFSFCCQKIRKKWITGTPWQLRRCSSKNIFSKDLWFLVQHTYPSHQ